MKLPERARACRLEASGERRQWLGAKDSSWSPRLLDEEKPQLYFTDRERERQTGGHALPQGVCRWPGARKPFSQPGPHGEIPPRSFAQDIQPE